jgi:hypothetical protein
VQTILALIADQLRKGEDSGELEAGAAASLRPQMLFDAYLANFDQAIFQNWTLEALQERAGEQISILLAGARRK